MNSIGICASYIPNYSSPSFPGSNGNTIRSYSVTSIDRLEGSKFEGILAEPSVLSIFAIYAEWYI